MSERRCGIPFMNNKAALRKTLRARRRQITGAAARQAAQAAAAQLIATPLWRRARRIALYLAADGEIDTTPLMAAAWQAGKTVYLPVIRPPRGQAGRAAALAAGHLVFRRYQPGEPLTPGLLGVPEPRRDTGTVIPINRLDLLIMPLVGFDPHGHRLGMGGGFYDRTLAGRGRMRSPRRIGWAHSCQKVTQLPADHWDISLNACVTNRKIIFW